jgi:hypothetical protein
MAIFTTQIEFEGSIESRSGNQLTIYLSNMNVIPVCGRDVFYENCAYVVTSVNGNLVTLRRLTPTEKSSRAIGKVDN